MTGVVRRWAAACLVGLIGPAGGCVGRVTDSSAPVDQKAPGRWTALTPMPSTRQEVAVAAYGGRVWVIGGFGAGAEPVSTVEMYDPAQNIWETRAALPVPIHHPAAAVVGDRLFVIGGYTGGRVRWTALDSVYEFVPSRETWEPRAPMPTPRGALAVAVLNGRAHALGGGGESVSNAHEVYDPATNRWARLNAMPTARDHLAAVAFQGRVWALGGRASFVGEQYANVEIYDLATDSWRTGVPLPAGRGGLAAAALPDRILVFGGEAPLRIFSATEMWESAGRRWIAKEPMPTPRHGIGAAVLGGRVFVPAGGTQPGFAASAANEAYTP
ncbi:MAG TPA: kelch repeat-containing protein [Methylomirabilota bacterium]|nr:kelch repeat-containing protein [Methylomirabilota bacterium]